MKLEDFLTTEEKAVMMAVATGKVSSIEGGNISKINRMLAEARGKK